MSHDEGLQAGRGPDRTAFVTRLKLILQHWPSADRLARAMGVSPSAFRKWLKGEAEPSRERLVSLANAAGVGVGWLVSGEGPVPDFQHRDPRPLTESGKRRSDNGPETLNRFIKLPPRATAAAAGASAQRPAWAETEFLALRQDWVRNAIDLEPDDLGLEIAVGDSMAPTIRDGNLLLLDTAACELGHFGIYVVEIGGTRMVKRIQRKLDGSVVLISDNASYEQDYIAPEKLGDIVVIGRVVWIGGSV